MLNALQHEFTKGGFPDQECQRHCETCEEDKFLKPIQDLVNQQSLFWQVPQVILQDTL